jgi:hypothetical protein
VTEISQAYDLAPDPDGKTIHLVQRDPVTRGPRTRYAYAVSFLYKPSNAGEAVPESRPTGLDPAAVRSLRSGPFLLTADRGTDGVTLLNTNGDGRAVPACPAPQALVLTADEKRLAVVCWQGDGAPRSRVVVFRTDFTARPWPAFVRTAAADFDGGLVAGAFTESGDRLLLVDRTGNRLLETDADLALRRSIPTGDEPVAVAVAAVDRDSRDRAAAEGKSRKKVREILARWRRGGRPFSDLAWTEAFEDGRRLHTALRPPDRLRVEAADGGVRLSQGGHSISVAPSGRFWVTPRQEILSLLWELPAVAEEAAIRLLAGDVPGSPFLRGGLAMDAVSEIEEGGDRFLVIGALRREEDVSQLWLDAVTAQPLRLVEAFPVFTSEGHGKAAFSGLVETRFHEPRQIAPGLVLPALLERVVDGRTVRRSRLEDVRIDSGIDSARFDPVRLGGAVPSAELVRPEPGAGPVQPAYLEQPGEPHPPFNSSPPTSGPRLSYIADWGPHALPVPLELQAHNLEHGGVLLQYNCPHGCPDIAGRLDALARSRDGVLSAPYPFMPAGIALTAWGHLERLDRYDEEAIVRFIGTYAGVDHHLPPTSPHMAP